MRLRIRVCRAVLAMGIAMGPLAAAAQPTFWSTGLNPGGSLLSSGVADPHYRIIGSTGNVNVTAATALTPVVINLGQLPGSWVQSPTARWIWQYADGSPTNVTLTYRTTVDLTGYNASTAVLSGQWSVDNLGFDVVVNGVSQGLTQPGFTTLTSFSLTQNLISGINNIDFVANDFGVIAGLLVTNTSVQAQALVVTPEPATFALVATALGVLTVARSRRRREANG
jgi:hypothetical protein